MIKKIILRRVLTLGIPAVTLLLAAAWFCLPSVRLAVRSASRGHVGARYVDAHRYDNDWFDAARAGRTDILAALLDAGYPLNATNPSGYTATILAAYDGQATALEFLLSRHADACHGDRNGNTALMGALYKGETSIARRLLETPCSINQANNAGETALSFAVLFGRLDFIPELLQHGADVTHRDNQGDSAFGVARRQGDKDAERALRTALLQREKRVAP